MNFTHLINDLEKFEEDRLQQFSYFGVFLVFNDIEEELLKNNFSTYLHAEKKILYFIFNKERMKNAPLRSHLRQIYNKVIKGKDSYSFLALITKEDLLGNNVKLLYKPINIKKGYPIKEENIAVAIKETLEKVNQIETKKEIEQLFNKMLYQTIRQTISFFGKKVASSLMGQFD